MNAKRLTKQTSQSESANRNNENTLSLNTYLWYLSVLDLCKLLTAVPTFKLFYWLYNILLLNLSYYYKYSNI